MSKRAIIILLTIAIFISLVPVMAWQEVLSFASVDKVLGIPVTNEKTTTTTTVPPNVKVVKINQAGQQTVEIHRVKVLSIDTVLDDNGLIKGFNVNLEIRAPSQIDVEVTVVLDLVDGTTINVRKTFTLNKGSTTVYVELANPVDLDDIVGIHISAVPS